MNTYRPNVGIALFNREGLVFIARRIADDGPETIAPGYEWQMPQGGIDEDEDPETAARRELCEETGITSVRILGAIAEWLLYDWPPYDGPPHRLSGFKGQRQKWFAMSFEGEETEINLSAAEPDEPAEFAEWRWEQLALLPALVVPFKQVVYRRVMTEFSRWARR